jgi:UDP-N-acetylglucosamine--dolichyl-phosphate N-acetylglucosaminephosphotransferase
MAKREKKELPECMGLVAAGVYLFAMLVFIPCCFYEYLVITGGGGNRDYEIEKDGQIGLRFPHNKVSLISHSRTLRILTIDLS